MEVEMEVDYLENGKMKWNLRKSFTTDTIRNLTPERAKHEGLGYFLIKLNAHQFFKRVDMENPAEMKENITKWFERKKVAFKDFVDDYLK